MKTRRLSARRALRLRATLAALVIFFPVVSVAADDAVVVLKAGRIHSGAGIIDGGMLLIRDGKISGLGVDLAIPEGAKVRDLGEAEITAGLIDANCNLDFELPQVGRERPGAMWADPRRSRSTNVDSYWTRERTPVWKQLGQMASAAHVHDESEPGALCLCGQPPAWMGDGASAEPHSLSVGMSPRDSWAEQSEEVIPYLRVADSVNLLSRDFERLARAGVTTVYVAPDSASVIGAQGAIVKTAGNLNDRMVQPNADIQAALGTDPTRRGVSNRLPPGRGGVPTPLTRRPTTRMGVDLVFRKAFMDAKRMAAGQPVHGADAPPAEAVALLNELREGKRGLRIHARMRHDIAGALRLAQEFGLRITLVEATEAYAALPALRAAKIPIIYGPIFISPRGWRARTGEAEEVRLSTATQLADAGLPFALTACELRDEEGLARQALFATKYGLPPEAALRAITAQPAELLGIADRCGTLAAGMDADLVVWNGPALAATSRPKLVMINGRVVHEE